MTFDDWDIQSEDDGLDYERAYDEAVKRHAKAQWQEDRDTGEQLDPLPEFGADEEEEAFEECFGNIVAQMGEVISKWDTADAREEEA